MTNISCKIFITPLLISVIGCQSNAVAETLRSSVNKACAVNPEIFSSYLAVKESEQNVKEAKSVIFPTVSSVSEIGFADGLNEDSLTINNSRPLSAQLTIDQPIYLGGRAKAGIRQAKDQLASQRFQSLRQMIDVQLRTISAYVRLAQAYEVVARRKSNIDTLVNQKNDAQRRFELGAGTKTDVVQADARIERGRAELINSEREVAEALAAYIEAAGSRPTERVNMPNMPPMPASEAEALDRAMLSNPDIKSANAQLAAVGQAVKTIQKKWTPEVRMIGSLTSSRDTAFNGFERDDANISVRMTVPLFDGGASSARKERGLLAENRSYHDRNLTINRVSEAISVAWARYEASRQLVRVNTNLANSAKSAAEAIKKESDAGFRSATDILDAQQEYLEAELALTESRFNSVLAAYSLRAIIGDIGISGLTHCDRARINISPTKPAKARKINILPKISISSPKKRSRRGPRGK